MRVIAGSAKRIALSAPKGLNTRPTSDRAKESLFNIISVKIAGARFLDVFCGSGAIGIEALSRGAKEAVFIDNDVNAIKSLNENLIKTKLHAEILQMPVEKAIKKLTAEKRQFDIIFLDPPYGSEIFMQPRLLAENGLLVAETESELKITLDNLHLFDTRVYGRTKFLFYTNGTPE